MIWAPCWRIPGLRTSSEKKLPIASRVLALPLNFLPFEPVGCGSAEHWFGHSLACRRWGGVAGGLLTGLRPSGLTESAIFWR
ncbi:hypothetical protein D3C84_1087580 [compost metagenome]